MAPWTHLIRFVAAEDDDFHLGQPVDTSRDVGLDVLENVIVKAYRVDGNLFDGKVTSHVLTVAELLSPLTREDCSYIRCIGMNYKDHAQVGHVDNLSWIVVADVT